MTGIRQGLDSEALVALSVDGLSKRYRIWDEPRPAYATLGDTLSRLVRRVGGGLPRSKASDVWALQDVSFELRRGEVLGVIGPNGAGKSTLLKILARITRPTGGRAIIRGRLSSLLEVGTGFHAELTGRENVFVNGAILGMGRSEVRAKLDSIVAFSGVSRYLDTPVKHYSSGMALRLAFAVAVHLEPDVLIVDEVLAVGDAEFQQRCFRRLKEARSSGSTVLLVSHNMAAISELCPRTLWLREGRIAADGETRGVVDAYLASSMAAAQDGFAETPSFRIVEVRVSGRDGGLPHTFEPAQFTVSGVAKVAIGDPGLYLAVQSVDEYRLAGLDLKDFTSVAPLAEGEPFTLGFAVESLPFLPGQYLLEVHLKDMETGAVERLDSSFQFSVAETAVYRGRRLDRWFGRVGLRATPLVLQGKALQASPEVLGGAPS